MWFEILPAFTIIVAAMAAPHGIAMVLNKLVIGNAYRRRLDTREQRLQYLRDRRVCHEDPYAVAGLEFVEGEIEEVVVKKKKKKGQQDEDNAVIDVCEDEEEEDEEEKKE